MHGSPDIARLPGRSGEVDARSTPRATGMIVVVESEPTLARQLLAVEPSAVVIDDLEALRDHLACHPGTDIVVAGPSTPLDDVLRLSTELRVTRPGVGVVLVRPSLDTELVISALRAGVRDVVKTEDADGLRGALTRARAVAAALRQRDASAVDGATSRGVVVTVFSTKGGCGKTTLACNLAATLAAGGRNDVCLVDLDLNFGDVAVVLRLMPARSLADAAPYSLDIDLPAVETLLTRHSAGLYTLPAPIDPHAAETISAGLVGRVLRLLTRRFAFVVVDTPPAFTDPVLTAFDQSDLIALVATLDLPAVRSLRATLDTLQALKIPTERLRVVLNRADSKVGLSASDVETTVTFPISAHVPSSRDVPASVNRGVPLVLEEPDHPVSAAIRTFAREHVLPLRADGELIPAALRSDRRWFARRRRR